MIGFVLRALLCNALVLALSWPVLMLTTALMETRGWDYLGALILALWVLLAVPVLWMRSYRWLEDHGKR